MKKVILTLLTATLVFSFTSLNTEVEAKETFKSCKELNKKYPKGVKRVIQHIQQSLIEIKMAGLVKNENMYQWGS
ncbi:hypothetical protein [Lysinibacillus pakistanensis]|uniref:hypothetical protein n=1 Tax=Lysinibacillus pakistanensis TaxID=759811 RepID=UPI003F735E18